MTPQDAIRAMKEIRRDLDSDGEFLVAELEEIRKIAIEIEDEIIEIFRG